MEVGVNVVYEHLEENTKRIVVEQGGTRSGKTYNILLWLIFGYCATHTHKLITISRKTFPALRASAMRDFFEILEYYDLYDPERHNKTNHEYIINNNTVEFVSLDQGQKIRGRKRNVFFGNEGNELTIEDWRQITFRTSELLIIDFNPSDEFHWIYDKVLTRDDVNFYITTYRDNPFLEQSLIDEIERLKTEDENYYRIYGLGQRGTARTLIFKTSTINQVPEDATLLGYGLDFGFAADPTALVAVYETPGNLYVDEMLYKTGLTGQDIANTLKDLAIDKRKYIYCDTGGGGSVIIEDLKRAGIRAVAAKKGRDSIADGIDLLRGYKLHITERSINVVKEYRNYKYKEDKAGNMTNTPIDLWNHAIDATRYVIFTIKGKPNRGKYHIS